MFRFKGYGLKLIIFTRISGKQISEIVKDVFKCLSYIINRISIFDVCLSSSSFDYDKAILYKDKRLILDKVECVANGPFFRRPIGLETLLIRRIRYHRNKSPKDKEDLQYSLATKLISFVHPAEQPKSKILRNLLTRSWQSFYLPSSSIFIRRIWVSVESA